jgi:hypothetical protein
MQKIFDAKTISSFNSAMTEAQALLGMHNQALNERTAAAKEFGLVSQAQIEQDGIALLRKRELLLTEFSQGEVNKAMAEKMNEYVQATVQAGKLVPENFKPILEQMAAAGLLTDAAGNAVDSLADAGVTGFGELSDASKELVKSLKELVDLLRQSMGLGPVTVPGGGGGGQPVRAPGEAGPRLPHFAEGGYTTPGPERLAWVGSPSGEHHVTGDSVPRLADEIAARIGMGGQTIVIPVHVGTTKVDEVVAQMVRNGGPLRDEIDRRVNG